MGAFKVKSLCSSLRVPILVMVFVAVAGSVMASSRRVLWESREQYVAIESQDDVKGKMPVPNDHPAEITQDRITDILSSIEFRPEGKNSRPTQLLTPTSISVLAPLVLDALRQATPKEDVSFAVIGLYSTSMGLGKAPKVTSGRLFYQGGKLNVIIWKAQGDYNERQDRRLDPFLPGSREYTADGDWSLLPQAGQEAMVRVRKDWITFDKNWKPAEQPAAAAAAGPGQPGQTPAAAFGALFSGKTGKVTERLTILKELRDKGVITEEEYRGRRLTILNEL